MSDSSARALPLLAIGPRVRKSPFFEATRRYGCKCYTVYNHTYMPVFYQSPEADFQRLIDDVTLWDVAAERQVEITGPDAARFTQLLVPRDLSNCAIGQCKYVILTDDGGGVINDPVLLRLGENHFWLSLADSDVLLWARGIAVSAGMDVRIVEPDVSPLQVQGPKSTALMTDLFGDWIESLRYYWFQETKLDGIPLVVSRTGWSGERGYEIFLRDGQYGDRLWERIMEAGRRYDIAPGAPSAIRRIEAGLLSHGADMTIENNPFELGLGRLIDLDQPADFIGKAALRRIKEAGVARRLVGLEIGGERLPTNEDPWPVGIGDGPLGQVTSAVHSPRLGRNIALAMVSNDHARDDAELVVETPAGSRSARVVPMPFFDPKKRLAARS